MEYGWFGGRLGRSAFWIFLGHGSSVPPVEVKSDQSLVPEQWGGRKNMGVSPTKTRTQLVIVVLLTRMTDFTHPTLRKFTIQVDLTNKEDD